MRRRLLFLAGALACAGALRAQAPAAPEVRLAIVVTRHGVRPPLVANKDIESYAAQPWPKWDAPPAYLTPHGRRQMVLMGAYYRELYQRAGLLTGRPADDLGRVYFVADSDQRTIETGRALGEGLVPGEAPEIHARPQGQPDLLFTPARAGIRLGDPSVAAAQAAILGRTGGGVTAITAALQSQFGLLERVLLGGNGAPPPGKVALLSLPFAMNPGPTEVVTFDGPLHRAEQMTDDLLLEYCEGMPMADVGWGRMSRADLTELLRLHALYFDLSQRTFYCAQAQGSNLASHMLATMEQAIAGRSRPGAIGTPGERMIVLVGHDTNQANLGGLLGLDWWLPGTQPNPMLPGGALVFELRRAGEGPWQVRIFYVSQSLEQTRSLEPLSLAHPPQTAAIHVPGCSGDEPGYDLPFEKFQALVRRVADPRFVSPGGY